MTLLLAGRDVRAVVFDFDGVLVDTALGWARAEAALCAAYGVEYTAELASLTHGVGVEDAVTALTAPATEMVDPAAAADLLRRLADEHVPADVQVLEGARESLTRLGRRVPVAIASNSERPLLERLLEATGLAGLVHAVVSASDVAAPKPAPDVYLTAADLLGTPPAETLVVEDSPTGASAGAAAGCPVAHLVHGQHHGPPVPGQVTTARGHHDLLAQLGARDDRHDHAHRSESRR